MIALLKSIWSLKESGEIPPSLKLVIVGVGSEENKLKKIINSANLQLYCIYKQNQLRRNVAFNKGIKICNSTIML